MHGSDADLTLAPVKHSRRRRWMLSLALRIYSVLVTRPLVLIRHTLSLKSFMQQSTRWNFSVCTFGNSQVGIRQCFLYVLARHLLVYYSDYRTAYSHTADSYHMAYLTGSLYRASHEAILLSNCYAKLNLISHVYNL